MIEFNSDVHAELEAGTFVGAVRNVPNNVYHGLSEYWSSTHLKYLSMTSPRHFYDKYVVGGGTSSEASYQMELGSLVHCLVLKPDDFARDFFKMPDLNLRTKDGKAERDALLLANFGRIGVTDEMYAEATAMAESVLSNVDAASLLKDTARELSLFWKCPFSDLNFKCKIDAIGETLVELKTTKSASESAFSRQAYNMNYDLSVMHYLQGVQVVLGRDVSAHFICVESEKPWVSQVYKFGDSFKETGHSRWLDAVTKLTKGVNDGHWPGYVDDSLGIISLEAPRWALPKAISDEKNEQESEW